MTYVVYHDYILSSAACKELYTVRRWNGPMYDDHIQMVMLYSRADLDKYLDVLKRHKVRLYWKLKTENRFVPIDHDEVSSNVIIPESELSLLL